MMRLWTEETLRVQILGKQPKYWENFRVSKAMKLVGSSQDLQEILGTSKYLVSWWNE